MADPYTDEQLEAVREAGAAWLSEIGLERLLATVDALNEKLDWMGATLTVSEQHTQHWEERAVKAEAGRDRQRDRAERAEEIALAAQTERDRLLEALTRLAHPAGPPPREEAAALYEIEVQQIARAALEET